jgi:anti-sigma regulatory factor (Ser/Thr protein kinase)
MLEQANGARIAVYDERAAAPRIVDVAAGPVVDVIGGLAASVYEAARSIGGAIPYAVVREVTENLIHAGFREVVVSVFDGGDTIRFADQGPGVPDKERALLPGFTTATSAMKRVIRGVGSGLPIVQDYLSFAGGTVTIDDNLGSGAVVTITVDSKGDSSLVAPEPSSVPKTEPGPTHRVAPFSPPSRISNRQKRVLFLALELSMIGPAIVARELDVALSTAYRDLEFLEVNGLLSSMPGGKRRLTEAGAEYVESLFSA